MASFLFTWPHGNLGERPLKLPKVRCSRTSTTPLRAGPSCVLSAGGDPCSCLKAHAEALQVGGASLAVTRDNPSSGIHFGADGLAIPLAAGKERMAKCKLGPYFARLPDGGNSLFAPGESQRGAPLTWLRVYVAQGGPEEWELDGIVWKTRRA